MIRPEHVIEPNTQPPLDQDSVRGLLVRSQGSRVARWWFDDAYPNVVHFLNMDGHFFDVNFASGIDRFLQNCSDNGVFLDREACSPMKAAEHDPKDSGPEEMATPTAEQKAKKSKGLK